MNHDSGRPGARDPGQARLCRALVRRLLQVTAHVGARFRNDLVRSAADLTVNRRFALRGPVLDEPGPAHLRQPELRHHGLQAPG